MNKFLIVDHLGLSLIKDKSVIVVVVYVNKITSKNELRNTICCFEKVHNGIRRQEPGARCCCWYVWLYNSEGCPRSSPYPPGPPAPYGFGAVPGGTLLPAVPGLYATISTVTQPVISSQCHKNTAITNTEYKGWTILHN